MKLKYRILWFEDDPDVIEYTHAPAIEEFLVDLGFEPIITHETNAAKLSQLMNSNAINNYDLIVSDNNLNATDGKVFNGNDIIKKLREGHILTEVLLYSSKPFFYRDVVEKHGWVERASYCVGRDNLDQRIKDIILLTVRKQQDVNNTRGLVIAETILLEKTVEHILESYFIIAEGAVLDESKEALLNSIRDKKKEHHDNQTEYFANIHSVSLENLINDDILTAANTVDAITSILNERIKEVNVKLNSGGKPTPEEKEALESKQKALKSTREELILFHKEILSIRNTLAHVVEEEDEDGTPYLKSLNKQGAFIRFDTPQYI